MIQVVVGSKNPVKIESVKQGFAAMFPSSQQFNVVGVDAASEVSDQPMSDNETLQGARNRAKHASNMMKDADYFVGVEGGCAKVGTELSVFAWIVVQHRDKRCGKARTATFFLPQEVTELIEQGKELGEAGERFDASVLSRFPTYLAKDDIVFRRDNSKQSNGSVGLLTNDAITRTTYYIPAVILALIPFINDTLTFSN